jgi:VanZ family protein
VRGLLLLVIALIVYGSLYPWQFDFDRPHDALFVLLNSWPVFWDRFVLRDVVLNVVLYAPLGAAAFLAMRRRLGARLGLPAAVALGFALSASMELLQAYDDHRDTSLLDLVANTAGSAAGALLAVFFEPAAERLAGRRRKAPEGAATLLAICWTGFQFYPFIPFFGTYRLRAALAPPWHIANVSSGLEIWSGAAEWFTLALALEAIFGRLRTRWLAAAMLAMPLRFFIVTRSLGWNDLLAAPLALVLWSGIPSRWRLGAGLGVVLSALLLRELAPFHWSAAAAPFQWIPFVPTLESERQSAVVIITRKAFDYGAAVWLLRAAGWSYARAGTCAAAALLGLELLQRHLPGRTAESTDAVLALLMAVALWLASDFGRRRGLG